MTVGVREVALELEDVADVGVPERVDRLVVVADHEQVAVLLAQELQQPVLGAVGVLVLVDEDPAECAAVALAHVLEELEQVDGAHQEVVEVHRVRLEHPPLVELVDVGHGALEEPALAPRAYASSVGELVLGPRDLGLHGAGREALRVELELLDATLHHPQRVGLVVDREGALVAQALAPRCAGSARRPNGRSSPTSRARRRRLAARPDRASRPPPCS